MSGQRCKIQGDLEEAIAKNEENIKRNNELILKFQEQLKNSEATRICHNSIHESSQKFDLQI